MESLRRILSAGANRLNPLNAVKSRITEALAASCWRLRWTWAIEIHLLAEGLATQPAGDDVARIASAFRQLSSSPEIALFHRYETQLHLMYQRACTPSLLLRTTGVRNEPNPISGHPVRSTCLSDCSP